MRQILVNLIGNAIKFTDEGEVHCRVMGEALDGAVRLAVSVRDTGIGIPANRQAHVFEAFRQVDPSTTRRHGGSGLGLAITRGLVSGMGGRLGVRSTVGEGSTFWFEIDLPPGRAPESAAIGSRAAALPRLRILLAEDNPINQRVGQRLLAMIGQQADVAADGLEAMNALTAESYDLVLMDVRMPELDGLEVTRRLRAFVPTARQPRVVALTANASREDEAACMAAGMDGFLSKPLRLAALEAVLGRLFDEGGAEAGSTGQDTADRSGGMTANG